MKRPMVGDRCWPILLKKSVNAVGPIFSASLVRSLSEDVADVIGQR
jgi:hypothetical protein